MECVGMCVRMSEVQHIYTAASALEYSWYYTADASREIRVQSSENKYVVGI